MKTRFDEQTFPPRKFFPALFLSAAFFLFSPDRSHGQNSASALRHRHTQTMDAPDEWKEIEIVPVAELNKNLSKENVVRNRKYEAFYVYDEQTGYRLFFTDRRAKKTYEIRGTGQPNRPFADLRWKTNRILVFDSWSSPRNGAHYEFDARAGKLKRVLIFRDDAESYE